MAILCEPKYHENPLFLGLDKSDGLVPRHQRYDFFFFFNIWICDAHELSYIIIPCSSEIIVFDPFTFFRELSSQFAMNWLSDVSE